jgi:hypothetical protein
MKHHKPILALLSLAMVSLVAGPAFAQRRARPARARVMARPGRFQQHLPQNWMKRLQRMSPEEQQRFLENNRRFQRLPAWRQEQIRSRLKLWNRLSPEQKRILIRRARILERMPPAERRRIRQVILPQWRQLPPARRRILVEKLRQLQPLSPEERRKRLANPKFERGLSPKERDLLREISKLRVGPGGGI